MKGITITHRAAHFSPERYHRYTLWRHWISERPFANGESHRVGYVQFIGLNPSTADEIAEDPTIRRCIGFADRWGYTAMCMTNLFALRSTNPLNMIVDHNPVGDHNDRWLRAVSHESKLRVAMWGKHGDHLNRGAEVVKMIPDLYCLHVGKGGEPSHILYLPNNYKLSPYQKPK